MTVVGQFKFFTVTQGLKNISKCATSVNIYICAGDRIESIRISLRHMVFEDALTILSYASPYEVQLEVESGASGASSRPSTLLRNNKRAGNSPTERICHPFYRSQSISDLLKVSLSSPHTSFLFPCIYLILFVLHFIILGLLIPTQ